MENQNPLQQGQKQEEQTSIIKGGATESNSQQIIPVATQPITTLDDVGRRCQ